MEIIRFLFIGLFSVVFCNAKAETSVWDGSSDTNWYNESSNEFHLTSASQLKGLADLVNNNSVTFEGKKIVLDEDIDLAGKLWTPIANGWSNGQVLFKGIFDGDNHSVYNIAVSNSTNPYGIAGVSQYYGIGLFGIVKEATIKNLQISCELSIENEYGIGNVGGLVGYANNSLIENIVCTTNIHLYKSGCVAVVGAVVGDGTTSDVIRVKSKGEIKGYGDANLRGSFGCVAGKANNMEECCSDYKTILRIYGSENCYIGGLAGYVNKIENSIYTGYIEIYDTWNKQNVFVGGIAGHAAEIANVISAPSHFTSDTSRPALTLGIIVPNVGAGTVSNAKYLYGVTNTPGNNGTSIYESELKSGNPIEGFSEEIWMFLQGEYPQLKAFIENDEKDEDDKVDEFGRINGVYYELDNQGQTAKVVSGDIRYNGDVVIQESIKQGGVSFEVKTVGDYAFSGCDQMKSIVLPSTIEELGFESFAGCYGLTAIQLPSNLKKIGNQCFMECAFKEIDIPGSVESIGAFAFSGCKLTQANIADGVLGIKEGAFSRTAISSVVIPKSVEELGNSPFSGCQDLVSIQVESGNSRYDSRDNCNAIIETLTNTMIQGCSSTIVPESVTIIGCEAFMDCPKLESINLSFVEELKLNAFVECKNLKSVILGKKVRIIGQQAFADCSNLTKVYCYAREIPTLEKNAFLNASIENATLYVLETSIEAYQSTEPWNKFKEIVPLTDPAGINSITDNAEKKQIRYNYQGQRILNERKGLIIARTNNGDVKKIIIR